MTVEELKQHCVRQITEFERIKEIMPVTPNGYKHYEEHKMVLQLIEALEQQPCEDCISRQAVHDLIAELLSDYLHDEDREKIEELDVKIEDLPPVTPKEKTGHWIFDEILDRHYYCSECKSMGVDYWDYCPECGAKMVESQESEE